MKRTPDKADKETCYQVIESQEALIAQLQDSDSAIDHHMKEASKRVVDAYYARLVELEGQVKRERR